MGGDLELRQGLAVDQVDDRAEPVAIRRVDLVDAGRTAGQTARDPDIVDGEVAALVEVVVEPDPGRDRRRAATVPGLEELDEIEGYVHFVEISAVPCRQLLWIEFDHLAYCDPVTGVAVHDTAHAAQDVV